MPVSEDLINFDIIENQKENIQSLPGGRSARALHQIFSGGKSDTEKFGAVPSPSDTRTLNDAIRQEYESELLSSADSDDPLDVYDRYVKWTLNAYPSAQGTAESGLLPLLERATKTFLSSTYYRNDPRYLKLWLHYIRLFSDSPRESFAFLARHHVGEGLALFYEEFAAWLEGAGRWSQAEEVLRLGIEREARPTERLLRKCHEFQSRYAQRSEGSDGPSSPALPKVRPALAAKIDPFASAREQPADLQAQQRARSGVSTNATSRSVKTKLAVFSDSAASTTSDQPPVSEQSKGWESIGSIRDRKKENTMQAKPWAGETLKTEKRPGTVQKMAIFKDESSSNPQIFSQDQSQIPDHHVREAVNPRTGRKERVFVNLTAVYPDHKNPAHEVSFEELRAISRGWMSKKWGPSKKALKQISGNANQRIIATKGNDEVRTEKELVTSMNGQTTVNDERGLSEDYRDSKGVKPRKIKVREIGETMTVKTNLDSPNKPKVKRKTNASEPTMTFHTRAATDEIYSIFNQPLKSETRGNRSDSLCESDYEDDDDDYTSAGESTGTGHISTGTSEFGEDETRSLSRAEEESEDEQKTVGDEWTEFSTDKHIPKVLSGHDEDRTKFSCYVDEDSSKTHHNLEPANPQGDMNLPSHRELAMRTGKFVLEIPEDYAPPVGMYRDAAVMAQNRLPFMTPITEKTEYSIASMTTGRNRALEAKTPCRPIADKDFSPATLPVIRDLLTSPLLEDSNPISHRYTPAQISPAKISSSRSIFEKAFIIKDHQCNPVDDIVRNTILKAIDPPLSSYSGYHDHSKTKSQYASEIKRFISLGKKPSRSGDRTEFAIPVLSFHGVQRDYSIRRELGAGAFAPVYLVKSSDTLSSSDDEKDTAIRDVLQSSHRASLAQAGTKRHGLEAMKVMDDCPSAWEFYIIRTAHERLSKHPTLARAVESIVNVHEFHLFRNECFLVEDYRGQGTLLDLVNIIRTEAITNSGNPEAGMDEVLAMFFSVELFRTVEALHACGLLHGDIKPDNCLVRFDDETPSPDPTPSTGSLIDLEEDQSVSDASDVHYSPRGLCNWRNKGLTLIDFGRGIDMKAFQPGVQFIADWEVGEHECNEIREMRPWTHQIDLYGVAGTIHAMLFGKYIETVTHYGGDRLRSPSSRNSFENISNNSSPGNSGQKRYRIREPLKRYWDREIWLDVFDLLLNPCTDRWMQMERPGSTENGGNLNNGNAPNNQPMLPVLQSMKYVRRKMEVWLITNAEKKGLALQIRRLEAHLSKRKERLDKEK